MADLTLGENSGVRFELRPTDFRAGGETGIVYEIVNSTADWEEDKPIDEWQRRRVGTNLGYDTMSCTNFSCQNSIESQIHNLLSAGVIPDNIIEQMHELNYFDANNKVNFSDWFNANVSGTTYEAGNTLQGPWDAVRKYGILPQSDGYAPNDFTGPEGWFDKSKITQAQYDKAKKFLGLFDVKYEWVPVDKATILYHLKQAPLHVLVPTCSNWNDKTVLHADCGVLTVNHAVLKIGQTDTYSKVLDHYVDFVKKLASNYYMPYALKGVVTVKKASPAPIQFHYTFNINLKYGQAASNEVHKLQEALQHLGYMATGQFGPFGSATKAALGSFQKAQSITDPDGAGTNFGPQSRLKMNLLTK